MIELPEGLTLARQLNETVASGRVLGVRPPTKPHKFCWFEGDASEYGERLANARITDASAFGIYVELAFDNGQKLCFNDGVNVRLIAAADAPDNYQLLAELDGGRALCFTVAMYGSIILHGGEYDNKYYIGSKNAVSVFAPEFAVYYDEAVRVSKTTLGMKAFLATEQRFPGIGNGVTQDILFAAGLHPKRKLATLTGEDRERLLSSVLSVLGEMTDRGGRDTETDLFGRKGGYRTKMSKASLASGCPVCGGAITKESYLGGSVYYCPRCQPLK